MAECSESAGEQLHTMLFHQGQHGRATGNQSLFVSQGDVFTRFNGRQGGADRPPTNPVHYRFGIAIAAILHHLIPGQDLGWDQTRQAARHLQLCLVQISTTFGLKLLTC